jgi:hypothetical protein
MDAEKAAAGDESAKALGANGASASTSTLSGIGGSHMHAWNYTLLLQTLETLSFSSNKEASDRQKSATIAGLVGIGPKNVIEGMIAAQLLAAHNAAMECYGRSMIGEQTFEGRRENLNQANKLSRTYAVLLEALDRHRSKGEHKVTVEHVHLHVGAQSAVGAVEPNAAVAQRDLEDQHDAKQLVHAPQQAVRSSNKEREAMPVASDAKRPMSPARRKIAGST